MTTKHYKRLFNGHDLKKVYVCSDRCTYDSCYDALIMECIKCGSTFTVDLKIQLTDKWGNLINKEIKHV